MNTIHPRRLAQFLGICRYEFRMQVLPTPSRTILTPSGSVIANGFFGTNTELLGLTPVFAAIASVIVLVGIAICTMIILGRFLKWQQFH
jgi:ABC-2 type transport system permease protein